MVRTVIALGIGWAAVAAAPAWAEHNTMRPPEATPADERTLDLNLKIGADGFRLGGGFFGRDGTHGAWLNGRVRPHGFVLDGRVQDGGGARNFRMNLDLEDLLQGWLRL
jgi:hypothetical protein